MNNDNDSETQKYSLGKPIDYADPRNLADEATVDIASINGLGNVEGANEPASSDAINNLITPVKPDNTRRVIPIPGISAG